MLPAGKAMCLCLTQPEPRNVVPEHFPRSLFRKYGGAFLVGFFRSPSTGHSAMSLPATDEGAVPRTLETHPSDAQRSHRMSGFVGFMLAHSNRDDLETWFKKPERGATIQPLPQEESSTYARPPEDLKRGAVLYSADQYYKEPDHRLRPSIWLVKLLTVIFLIPASLVFAFSRAWRAVFRVSHFEIFCGRWRAYIALQPKASTAPSLPSVALSAEPGNKPAGTSHSPAPPEREGDAASPSTPHVYSSDGPWSFARSWALYVVYIPTTRYHGVCSCVKPRIQADTEHLQPPADSRGFCCLVNLRSS
jgi:hypothetical protein